MENFLKSFKPILKRLKYEAVLLFFAFLFLVLSSFFFFISVKKPAPDDKEKSQMIAKPSEKNTLKIDKKRLKVDLSGAVNNPDVYEVTEGARLKDLIVIAEGISESADRSYFARNFNLARLVKDEEKIYIPTYFEVSSELVNNSTNNNLTSADEGSGLYDLNQATLEELDTLPGVGQVTASKIIDSRPYSSIEELITNKVVNKSVYEKIKDSLYVR